MALIEAQCVRYPSVKVVFMATLYVNTLINGNKWQYFMATPSDVLYRSLVGAIFTSEGCPPKSFMLSSGAIFDLSMAQERFTLCNIWCTIPAFIIIKLSTADSA